MKRPLQFLALVIGLSACVPARAQSIASFGVTFANCNSTLSMSMPLAQAQVKYSHAYARLKAGGSSFTDKPWSDSQFMALDLGEAAWWEIVCASTDVLPATVNTSRGIVDCRMGMPLVTHTVLPIAYGQYLGNGTFTSYIQQDANATNIIPDKAHWLGDPKRINGMESVQWGRMTGSASYTEALKVDGFRITGTLGTQSSQAHDPSFEGNGIALWNTGENAEIGSVKCDNFNDAGIVVAGATPLLIRDASVFNNGRAGILFEGNWGGTATILQVSADDNPYILETSPGLNAYGTNDQGGGTITVLTTKSECGTSPASATRPPHGQGVALLKGQFGVTFVDVNYSSGAVHAPSAFDIDARLVNGTPQGCKLTVGDIRMNGTVIPAVNDIGQGNVYSVGVNPGEPFGFKYTTNARAANPFVEDNGIPFTKNGTAGGGTGGGTIPPTQPKWSKSTLKAPPSILNTGLSVTRLKITGGTFTFPANSVQWINENTWIFDGAILTNVTGTIVQIGTCTSGVKVNLDMTYPQAFSPKHLVGSDAGTVTMSADMIEYY